MKPEKWIQTAIGALIGTAIVTFFTGNWLWFLLLWITSIPPTRIILYCLFEKKSEQSKKSKNGQVEVKTFVVSEYFSRMEQAALDILEAQKTIDKTIILWWGLDGLRLKDDGKPEWVSRRKPEPVTAKVFYQPCQSIQNAPKHDWRNQVQTAAIASQLQPPMLGYLGYSPYMQSALVSPLQQCCVQCPVQYPSYYYGGCCRLN